MSRAIDVGAPDWKPLECVLSRDSYVDFMFMGTTGAIVLYKHRNTRRYLNIEAASHTAQKTGGRFPALCIEARVN
jgi:hypothetical protein